MRKEDRKKETGPVLALWALLAGSSIYKILAVLTVMGIAEGMLFCSHIRVKGDSFTEYRTLTAAVEGSHISLIFVVALGLICFLLAWTEGRLDAKSSGTMLRLRLSGSRIFWIRAAYNAACLVLLFVVQIWLCIWFVGIYERMAGAAPQRLFLAFYRLDFLHCLLPMADGGRWVRNILLLCAFAVGTAGRMEKTEYVPLILLYNLTAVWFVSPLGGRMTDWLAMLLYVMMAVVTVWRVYKAEREKVQACE